MSKSYNPTVAEAKWQKKWEEAGVYRVDLAKGKKPFYCLVMFPYPSGARLHVGHWFQYGPTDSYARFLKMRGHDVFFPMGFDAFGLPAENFAIKTGFPPAKSTAKNVAQMIEQFRRMGCMYDWSKSLNTADPSYYRWTQWLFLKMYEKGLAYRKEAPVNFCPRCQTVLAREQCQEGTCERCETQVIQKPLTQWFWKLTQYAERLLLGLDALDWPEKTKLMQRHWIGKSQGAEIHFAVDPSTDSTGSPQAGSGQVTPPWEDPQKPPTITVFTTRPDTLFGATYLVLAPEHTLVAAITTKAQRKHVEAYVKGVTTKSELQRTDLAKEKTGVFTGAYALHPVTGERIPIWIADYVLVTYGTGAVMAVPAHDERDWDFARRYKLEVKTVVMPVDNACHSEGPAGRTSRRSLDKLGIPQCDTAGRLEGRHAHAESAFTADGISTNSDFLNGLKTSEAKKRMVAWLEDEEKGREVTTYRLHDWLVSRQRYWGAPIPIVYDPKGAAHPIPEKHLPWLLPTDVEFKPTGESPLKKSHEFQERTESLFGKGWTPEYDTMDTFVCSSFYYLRFLAMEGAASALCHPEGPAAMVRDDSSLCSESLTMTRRAVTKDGSGKHYDTLLVDPSIEKKWLPVQTYIGGPEHACMHLIYARFLMMALKDFGIVSHEEPFKKLVHQGLVTNKGAKMSKSKGNVVDPDPLVERYGSDVFRMYLMFMGPYTDGGDWSATGIKGIERFTQRIWKLYEGWGKDVKDEKDANDSKEVLAKLHGTIKKMTEDMEQLHFNTAISSLMEFLNFLEKQERISRETLKTFAILLAPLAPHLAEELWEKLCLPLTASRSPLQFVVQQPWPSYDPRLLLSQTMTIVVQVNGKVRANVELPADATKEDVLAAAKRQDNIKKYLVGAKVKKEIYIPGKLVNFVV